MVAPLIMALGFANSWIGGSEYAEVILEENHESDRIHKIRHIRCS